MTETIEREARDQKEITAARRVREIVGILAKNEVIKGLTPERLLSILEDLGPTFVKLGQIMSMRADMIPEEYCRELTKLRADVRPMEFGEVIAMLEQEYGAAWQDIFAEIDPEPLGSASIAQAHAAVLQDGRQVVIKVQRPNIYERMAQDVKLLHKASGVLKIVSGAGKVIDLNTVIDEMWAVAQQELDFLIEAGHIREFTELNEGINYIAFPWVEWSLTTPRVLMMEDIEGIQIDDREALLAAGYDPQEICEKLAANYVKQVIRDGFFHADPHPGNIRVRDGKIVWIDLGMAGRLTNRDRQLFRSAVAGLVENDIYSLTDIVLAIGKHDGKVSHDQLYSDIEDVLVRYGSLEFGSINAGQFLTELVRIAAKNGISMPHGVSILGRGIITIEGVLSKINPEISLIQIITMQMAGSVLDDFDPVTELKRSGRLLYSFSKRAAEIPIQLSDILKMTTHGQVKLNISLTDSAEQLKKLGRMTNRMIFAILAAAIIVGSSLLSLSDLPPAVWGLPLLAFLGYLAAFLIIAGLTYSMIRRRKGRMVNKE